MPQPSVEVYLHKMKDEKMVKTMENFKNWNMDDLQVDDREQVIKLIKTMHKFILKLIADKENSETDASTI